MPKKECHQVPDQVCINQPEEKCVKKPVEECNTVHKKVPVRVSKKIPKKVCNDVRNQAPITDPPPKTTASPLSIFQSEKFAVELDYDVFSDSDNFTVPLINVYQVEIDRRNQEPEIDVALKTNYLEGTHACNVTHCQNNKF